MIQLHTKTLLLTLGLALATTADAQRRRSQERGKPGLDAAIQGTTEPGVAWFGRWDDALAEAKRTGKPIFLMSAAPQCTGVPGMW